MAASLLNRPIATPVLTWSERRLVRSRELAAELGQELGANRRGERKNSAIVASLIERDEIALPQGLDSTVIFERIFALILADRVYDSEGAQASRASATIFGEVFGETVEITGWFGGMKVVTDQGRFELTGGTCPKCELNPECYGEGWSGVRCLDTQGCGWWFCY